MTNRIFGAHGVYCEQFKRTITCGYCRDNFAKSRETAANEIGSLDPHNKTLSKCCIDPLRPPDLLGRGMPPDGLVDPHFQVNMKIHSLTCYTEIPGSLQMNPDM
jgi:hypothetical protein